MRGLRLPLRSTGRARNDLSIGFRFVSFKRPLQEKLFSPSGRAASSAPLLYIHSGYHTSAARVRHNETSAGAGYWDTEEQRKSLLQRWANSKLAEGDLEAVDIFCDPVMGLGLSARRKIYRGEEVLRLGKSLWGPVSADEALRKAQANSPEFVSHLLNLEKTLEDYGRSGQKSNLANSVALALQLLFEAGDPASPSRDYFLSLPRSIDSPLMWSQQQLEELRGTSTFRRTLHRLSFLSSLHTSLFPSSPSSPPPPVSLPLFVWALSVVLSRAVSGADRPFTFVPVFDCLNHRWGAKKRQSGEDWGTGARAQRGSAGDAEEGHSVSQAVGCDHFYDSQAEAFVVVAQKDFEVGEQLFISYGRHDNDSLLRLYGFAVPENAFDVAELDIKLETGLDKATALQQRLLQAVKSSNASQSKFVAPDTLRLTIGDQDVPLNSSDLAELRALHLIPMDLEGQMSAGAVDLCQPLSLRLEKHILNMLEGAIESKEKEYKSTLNDDESLLAQSPAPGSERGGHSNWMKHALCVRVGQRRALKRGKEAIKTAKQEIERAGQ